MCSRRSPLWLGTHGECTRRVDVFLPLDAEVKVKINHRSVGKETVLAVLK